MAWHRKITEKAFFILFFALVSALGVAYRLGISGNQLLETMVNAVISTIIAILLAYLVFSQERRKAGGG